MLLSWRRTLWQVYLCFDLHNGSSDRILLIVNSCQAIYLHIKEYILRGVGRMTVPCYTWWCAPCERRGLSVTRKTAPVPLFQSSRAEVPFKTDCSLKSPGKLCNKKAHWGRIWGWAPVICFSVSLQMISLAQELLWITDKLINLRSFPIIKLHNCLGIRNKRKTEWLWVSLVKL